MCNYTTRIHIMKYMHMYMHIHIYIYLFANSRNHPSQADLQSEEHEVK